MRLPLPTPIKSRNGLDNKDARMVNVLKETRGQKEIAAVRPGLATAASTTGNGNGMGNFNDTFIAVYGTAVKRGGSLTSVTGSVTNAMFDFVEATT